MQKRRPTARPAPRAGHPSPSGSCSPPTRCGTGWRTRASSPRWRRHPAITIERNETEDEFAFFAGGHADIVSMGSYEVPVLEKETGVKTVTFAKYNMAKDILVRRSGQGLQLVRRSAEARQGRPRVRDELRSRLDRPGRERGTRAGGEVGRPADRDHRLRRRARAGPQGTTRRRLHRLHERHQVPDGREGQHHVRRQGRFADLRSEVSCRATKASTATTS